MANYYTSSEVKSEIDTIRDDQTGRQFIAVDIITSDCPTCTIDSITGLGSDPMCPQCGGLGRIDNKIESIVTGAISWGPLEDKYTSVGTLREGEVSVDVSLDDEDTIDSASYLNVDGKKVCRYSKHRLGLGIINRIVFICKDEGVLDDAIR